MYLGGGTAVRTEGRLDGQLSKETNDSVCYPKYHCELNFIVQYWGAVKFCYHNTPKTKNIGEIKKKSLHVLMA